MTNAFCWSFLLLFALMSCRVSCVSTVAYSEVQAIEGRESRLACNTTTASWQEEEEAIHVSWYRTGVAQPVFVVDGRNSSSLANGMQIPSPDLQGRVAFDASPVPTLRIKKVLRSDEGEYRCRSVYRRQRIQKCLLLMTVISEYRPPSSSLLPISSLLLPRLLRLPTPL